MNLSAKPTIEVLNKTDLLSDEERAGLLARAQSTARDPGIGAIWRWRLTEILRAIDAALHTDPLVEADFVVPQDEGGVLAAIEAGTTIKSRQYEGNNVRLSVTGPASLLGRMSRFRVRNEAEGVGRSDDNDTL